MFSVRPEPFTIVARADTGIKIFDDLKGKREILGNPGSGSRGTMDVAMKANGRKPSDVGLATELKSSGQTRAVCQSKIDAMVFTVGHSCGSIKEATTECEIVLV